MQGLRKGFALVAALVIAVALVLWMAWSERDGGRPATAPSVAHSTDERPLPSFAVDGQAPANPADAAPLDEPEHAVGALSPTGAPRVVVRVTWAADGTPAEGIQLHLFAADQPDPAHNLIDGLTDAQGLWILEPAPLGNVGVYSDRDGAVVGKVEDGRVTELALALPKGTLVRGRVLNPRDLPVAGAEVWLSDVTNWMQGAIVARTDDAGRFEVQGVGGERWVGARSEGFTPSSLVTIPRDAPPEMDVEVRLGPAGGTVRGVVVDPRGAPIAGAFVQVGPGIGWPGPDGVDGRRGHGPPPFQLRTTPEGDFAVEDVPPGVVPIEVLASGWTPLATSIDVAAGEAQDLRLQLEPGATVSGVARDPAGVAVADASITVGTHPREPGYVRVTSDAAGRYELRDPPKGQQGLAASKRGVGEDRITLDIQPGQTLTWDPVLGSGLQILGRVRDESGAPVEGLLVRCIKAPHFTGTMKTARVAADGRFAILNCDEAEHRLSVFDPGDGAANPVLASVEGVRPGPGEVLISIPADARVVATVMARVLDSGGQAPLGLQALLAPPGEPIGLTARVDASTGDVVFDAVRAGDQQLHVLAQGHPNLTRDVPAVRAGERRDLGTIVLDDPGRVILHVTLPPGVGPEDVVAILDHAQGPGAVPFELLDESAAVWVSRPVAPGDWVVSLGYTSGGEDEPFIVPGAVAVRVESGTDARVDMIADRGVAQNLTLFTARQDPPATRLRVVDSGGTAVCDEPVMWEELQPGASQRKGGTSFVARPGAYTLTVELDGQVVVQQALSLSAAVNMAPDLDVVVP